MRVNRMGVHFVGVDLMGRTHICFTGVDLAKVVQL